MKILALVIALVSGFPAFAGEEDPAFALSFGPMMIGEERIPMPLSDFPLIVDGATVPVEAKWIEGSVQWVRIKNNMMLPRARMRIEVRAEPSRVTLQYLDRALTLQGDERSSSTELYFSLFHPGIVQIFIDGKAAGKIVLKARPMMAGQGINRHMIDYSCAPWGVEVKGFDGEFLTMSCQMQRVGELGSEEPMLEIYWSAVNVRLADGRTPPFTAVIRDNRSVKTTVIGAQGERRTIEIVAKVPPKMRRLKFAGGLGYPTKFITKKSIGEKKSEIAPAVMLYGNFWLTDELSIRGFDAATSSNPMDEAFFNNFGVYFAYDLARPMDKRVQIVALLGFQGLTFAYDGLKHTTFSQAIFPQGFEVVYLHAFGLKNHVLGGGMFIQPSSANPYQNVWVRFGKRWFGELNYIAWQSGEMSAAMWGFSVGFPLGQFY